MELANKHRIPVLPRGGGTSLAGQTVNNALVIDFSKHLDQILEVNPEEMWARVQPGIVLEQLNRQVSKYGLQYAPDPSTTNRACVGGGIGNNSCGAHSVIYGKTSDHILGMNVVLSDGKPANFYPLNKAQVQSKLSGIGLESDIYRSVLQICSENHNEILKRYPNIMRRVSGYNLDKFLGTDSVDMTQMIIGSEGTLCIVTDATVKLVRKPISTSLVVIHFNDVSAACDAIPDILEHTPSAVELVDHMMIERTRNSIGFAKNIGFIEGDPGAILLVEFYGDSILETKSISQSFKTELARRNIGYASIIIENPTEQANVWNVRKAALGLLMSAPGNAKPIPFVEDTAVEPAKLGEFVRRFNSIVKTNKTEAAYYGHASVGCLHIRPLVNFKSQDGINTMVQIASEVVDLVTEFGGALSGEHGDGIVRGVWTERVFGSALYQAFLSIKHAFDPNKLMNPGKIVECPPIAENLRHQLYTYREQKSPKLDFFPHSDILSAVEMCNGMGACRKHSGTMCPSYIATKDEEHSTRGRANLLRSFYTGQLTKDDLAIERIYQALDLCLECKGCKWECPSSVDMAAMKSEFLDSYNSIKGVSLRTRLFANISRLSKWGSYFAPISNWLSRIPGARSALHHMLGIHHKRPLPTFARQSFDKIIQHRPMVANPINGEVILFKDTFMNYNTPTVGTAALDLLEKTGFQPIVPDSVCCGRPMISKGLLDQAREQAQLNLDLLIPYVKKGLPIIGCEASCLSTIRDEYPRLLKSTESKLLADNTYLIDEFLDALHANGKLSLQFNSEAKKVLLHGHCHQKAGSGTEPSLRLLRMPPNFDAYEIEAGCCGMAGSFGFEKEHYSLSMTIGNKDLFPAINSTMSDWEIATTGISCRQQIEHGTGRRPRHVVEILRDAVV
jgi:FAD/FMN-containing dehydrogenase/Fe-S oxidoreductase